VFSVAVSSLGSSWLGEDHSNSVLCVTGFPSPPTTSYLAYGDFALPLLPGLLLLLLATLTIALGGTPGFFGSRFLRLVVNRRSKTVFGLLGHPLLLLRCLWLLSLLYFDFVSAGLVRVASRSSLFARRSGQQGRSFLTLGSLFGFRSILGSLATLGSFW